MARIARAVAPGIPHHIIQRGNMGTGRPLGEDPFIKKMENLLDRKLKPQKPYNSKKKDK